jgi:hypothetical protein
MSEDTNPTSEQTQIRSAPSVENIVKTFIAVVTRPAEFFSAMPRTGGFVQPLIFMVIMGVAGGVVRAVLGILGLLNGVHLAMAFASIIIAPILIAIFGFVGAAILYVVWKIMGSDQSFETAYRCTAYGGAISPITQALMVIPYLGIVLVMAWWTLILVIASTRVHRIRQGVAATVFGIIAAIFAVTGISAQVAARHMENALNNAQNNMHFDKNDAKDPGKAMQDLGKMFEKIGKAAQDQQNASK